MLIKENSLAVALLLSLLSPLCGLSAALSGSRAKVYPYRWVYVSRSLHRDADVSDIRDIVKTASEHGLNGMVLAAGLDRLDRQPSDYFQRLQQIKQICKKHDIEIIPIVFSVGYGGSILAHDRNLAAGIPVRDAPFAVENGKARLIQGSRAKIANGGFEDYSGNRLEGYRFHDKPGYVSFIDTKIFKNGRACLRFENFGKYQHGHARLMQEVTVQPNRCYKLSCWVKTDSLQPEGCLRMTVLSPDGRNLAPWDPRVPSTTNWREIVCGFNSLTCDKVRLYIGVWGGREGRFWVDDLKIKEVALLNVLKRPGTPVVVRKENTDIIYQEGKDFTEIRDHRLNFRFDHEPPAIEMLPESRIKNGERLRVSYYHGIAINRGQVTACMSEPQVYEIWKKQVRLLHKHLTPTKYLLSMDEIRAGGACRACKNRKMTMAQILGDCITKQVGIIRDVNPEAEIFIWSDMLDPNHNARDKYYLVDGDFSGSWKYVPKDLIIVCWYYRKRRESLKFFSSLGFKTLAGAYYDGDSLDNPTGWLEVLDRTPKACGIMYTTWRNKYELLAPFGDLVYGSGN